MPWSEMAVLVRSGRDLDPAAAPGARRGRRAGRGGQRRDAAGPRARRSCRCSTRCAPSSTSTTTTPTHADYLDAEPRRGAAALAARRARRHRGAGAGPAPARAGEGAAPRPRHRAAAPVPRAAPRGACSTPAFRRTRLRPSPAVGSKARRARRRCCAATPGRLLDAGGTAEEVLWVLWSGTDWPERLRRGVEPAAGGRAGSRTATSTRSARCSTSAARAEEQRGHTGRARASSTTLVAQQIPADTLAERGVRGDAVRLLTAHRAKGLEWRLVVVAHVQEEGWPDLRRRVDAAAGRPDRQPTGVLPPVTARELLAEERRLFYVACTRARERLVVTAVASPDDDGEQPSRFLDELGRATVDAPSAAGRPGRCRWPAWSAELRRTVADPRRSRSRCATRPRAGWPGSPASTAAAGRWCPRPTRRPGGGPRGRSRSARAGARPRRAGAALGQRARGAADLPGAVVPRARGGRRRARPPVPRASARSCTRSPTGRRGRARRRSRRRRRADGARRHGLGQIAFRTPWSGAASARRSRRR